MNVSIIPLNSFEQQLVEITVRKALGVLTPSPLLLSSLSDNSVRHLKLVWAQAQQKVLRVRFPLIYTLASYNASQ